MRRRLLAVALSLVVLAGLVAGLLIYSQTRAARAQIRALVETNPRVREMFAAAESERSLAIYIASMASARSDGRTAPADSA